MDNRRDMFVMALKLVAENIAKLTVDPDGGVISISARTSLMNPSGPLLPSVLMEEAALRRNFADDDLIITADRDYIYIIEDGVQFYALRD